MWAGVSGSVVPWDIWLGLLRGPHVCPTRALYYRRLPELGQFRQHLHHQPIPAHGLSAPGQDCTVLPLTAHEAVLHPARRGPEDPETGSLSGARGSLQLHCSAQGGHRWLRAGPEMGDDTEKGNFRLGVGETQPCPWEASA